MAIRTREIYRSAPNGDRWLLAHDADIGQVFVRHEPNLRSGGEVANIDIGAFLIAPGSGHRLGVSAYRLLLKAAALICPRPVHVPLDLPDLLLSASCLW